MNTHYVTVYTTVFAVMFNVMVFISQGLGAFKVPSASGVFGLLTAVFLVVIAPVLFFSYALAVIEKLAGPLRPPKIYRVLYWVTPVYGFQQLWLFIAWLVGWADFGNHTPGKEWVWWLIAFAAFGLAPALQVWRAYPKAAQQAA